MNDVPREVCAIRLLGYTLVSSIAISFGRRFCDNCADGRGPQRVRTRRTWENFLRGDQTGTTLRPKRRSNPRHLTLTRVVIADDSPF